MCHSSELFTEEVYVLGPALSVAIPTKKESLGFMFSFTHPFPFKLFFRYVLKLIKLPLGLCMLLIW